MSGIVQITKEDYEELLKIKRQSFDCYKKLDEVNGWSNYMTWDVALWIDNEVGTYKYWREVAEHMSIYDLAQRLREEIEEEQPEIEASLYTDILGFGLQKVNWYEIAKHLKED